MIEIDISSVWWIFSAVVLFAVSYMYMTWPYNYFKKRGIPGPKPVPFLGNMNEFGKQPFWIKDEEWVQRYGKVFGLFFFGKKSLMVTDLEILKEVFIKDFEKFSHRTELPNRGILKHGLVDMNGPGWRTLRQQLSPYFSAGTMKMSANPINKVLDNLIEWLNAKCDADEMVDARRFSQMMTMDAICSTAFGVGVNSCKNPDVDILKQANGLFKQFGAGNVLLILAFVFPSFGKLLDLLGIQSININYFKQFTGSLIAQRKEVTENRGHDFVNVLLKERKGSNTGLTDDEIIANAVLFLLAGYDTTAGSLSLLLYNLTIYPECQEEVYREIQEYIGDEDPTYETVQKLSYLEMCLEESLRLYPVAPRTERTCIQDTVIKGVHIEKGTSVIMPLWQIHRDPEIWEDPGSFKPERFTAENKKNRDPITWAPFGLGQRHCIGMRLALMELKMATVRILQKFRLLKNEKTQIPLVFDPKFFGMTAKDGVWLTLERRIGN